jgi:hypothetical protein
LKTVKDGASQVQKLNSEWTYGSSIREWSAENLVEQIRSGHPPAGEQRGGIFRLGVGNRSSIRGRVSLLIIGVCILLSGCRRVGVQTIWSAEARSPDEHWLASARTEQRGGFGTAGVETDVYLKWINGSKPPEAVLVFFHDPTSQSDTINLSMKWLTPSHLDVSYNGHPRVDFQVVKYGDVDISLRDLSSEKIDNPK